MDDETDFDARHDTPAGYTLARYFTSKTQYGIQVVWVDPAKAGQITAEPQWYAFDTEEQAERFRQTYQCTLGEMAERMSWIKQMTNFDPNEVWTEHNVKKINRATRWAVEEYGEWEVV